jgi:hypothetical protein
MSGDHQQWDEGPIHAVHSTHTAPKPNPDHKKMVRSERIRVTVWIVLWLLIISGGVAIYRGWRPWSWGQNRPSIQTPYLPER